MSSFNFFILTFFMKYFPGDIFANSLCFALSDTFAFTLCGIVLKYAKVVSGFRLAFLVSAIEGVFYILFSAKTQYIPFFVILSRIGVTMAFNLG